MISAPAVGDLGFATSVSCYQPDLDMHLPTARPFGLTEQSTYLYGGWRDESGAPHIVERKFCGPMTAGLWMMTTRSGKVTLAPESLQTVRGEVKRENTAAEHHLYGSLLGKAGGAPPRSSRCSWIGCRTCASPRTTSTGRTDR